MAITPASNRTTTAGHPIELRHDVCFGAASGVNALVQHVLGTPPIETALFVRVYELELRRSTTAIGGEVRLTPVVREFVRCLLRRRDELFVSGFELLVLLRIPAPSFFVVLLLCVEQLAELLYKLLLFFGGSARLRVALVTVTSAPATGGGGMPLAPAPGGGGRVALCISAAIRACLAALRESRI